MEPAVIGRFFDGNPGRGVATGRGWRRRGRFDRIRRRRSRLFSIAHVSPGRERASRSAESHYCAKAGRSSKFRVPISTLSPARWTA